MWDYVAMVALSVVIFAVVSVKFCEGKFFWTNYAVFLIPTVLVLVFEGFLFFIRLSMVLGLKSLYLQQRIGERAPARAEFPPVPAEEERQALL